MKTPKLDNPGYPYNKLEPYTSRLNAPLSTPLKNSETGDPKPDRPEPPHNEKSGILGHLRRIGFDLTRTKLPPWPYLKESPDIHSINYFT